jgi:hypothetical protein
VIWQETRTTLGDMNAVIGPDTYSMSTASSELLPVMRAINGIFERLDQVAPPAMSADMATLSSFWNQIVTDFNYGSTLGEVKAYIKAHPPAESSTVTPAVHGIDNYLATTCHLDMSS